MYLTRPSYILKNDYDVTFYVMYILPLFNFKNSNGVSTTKQAMEVEASPSREPRETPQAESAQGSRSGAENEGINND